MLEVTYFRLVWKHLFFFRKKSEEVLTAVDVCSEKGIRKQLLLCHICSIDMTISKHLCLRCVVQLSAIYEARKKKKIAILTAVHHLCERTCDRSVYPKIFIRYLSSLVHSKRWQHRLIIQQSHFPHTGFLIN